MTDDGQLLRQYAENQSEAAFAELVRRYLSLVYHTALRRLGGNHHAAADVAQGVFILLARKARSLHRHPTLIGWLYSAVNFEASSQIRSAWRRQIREKEASITYSVESKESSIGEGESLRPILDEVLMELGETDRAVVLLRFFQARPIAEVGKQLGISEAAAQRRILRALDKLRVLLAKRDITSTSAALALAMTSQSALAAPPSLAASIPPMAMSAAGNAAIGMGGFYFYLMSSVKIITAGTALALATIIVAVLASGFGLYQFRLARDLQSALRNARSELAAKHEILQGLPSLGTGKSVPAKPQRPTGPVLSPKEQMGKFFAAFPETREMFVAIFKPDVTRAYGPFFRSVNLTPDQITKFTDAVIQSRLDAMTVSATNGFSPTKNVLPPEAQLRGILGDELYQQFKDYTQVQPAFEFITQAAVAGGLAGEHLSDDQTDQLAKLIIKNTPAPLERGPIDLGAVNWDQVLPQAEALVSPPQWTAMAAEFSRMHYQQALAAASAERVSAASTAQK